MQRRGASRVGKMESLLKAEHNTLASAMWALHRIQENGWKDSKLLSLSDAADLIGISVEQLSSVFITNPLLAPIVLPITSAGKLPLRRIKGEALLIRFSDFDSYFENGSQVRYSVDEAESWQTGKSGLDSERAIPVNLFLIVALWHRSGFIKNASSFDAFYLAASKQKLELVSCHLQGKSTKSGTKHS